MVPGSISLATWVAPSLPRIEIQDGSVASSSIRVAPTTAGAGLLETLAAGLAVSAGAVDLAAAGCSVTAGTGFAGTG